MIPKLSAPLVKDIRTGEGIFEWVLGVLDIAAGATGNLSIAKTGTFALILAISKGARRLLLKTVAAQKGAGIGDPLQPAVLGQVSTTIGSVAGLLAPTVEQALAEIAAAAKTQANYQTQPGTPAGEVASGLAADPPDPAAKA